MNPPVVKVELKPLGPLKVGDIVTRYLGGTNRMELKVTQVTKELIHCGPWTFDPYTGAEVDKMLDWGPPPKNTGSFIQKENA